MNNSHQLHIVVMGARGVGKTSLIRNYWHEPFLESIPASVGINNFTKTVSSSDGWRLKLTVTDVGGYEGFRALNRFELKDAQVVIICYDVTDRHSWIGALRCLDDTLSEHVRVYFCGTKTDLVTDECPRIISVEVVKVFARHVHGKLMEASARVPKSSDLLFKTIIDDHVRSSPDYKKWRLSFLGKIVNLFHF